MIKFLTYVQKNAMAVTGLITALLGILFAFVKLSATQTAAIVAGISAIVQFSGHIVVKTDGLKLNGTHQSSDS